jgi:hypothetical protein
MPINPNAVSTGYASRGAAPATGHVDNTPISAPPAGIQRTAELNAEIAPNVREFSKQTSVAPQDGVDQSPASSSNTEPKAPGPKAPDPKPLASDTQAAVDQANKEAIVELKKHNAFELMKMVRSGDIPAAILDNPVAMNLMLERVQGFSRMIQMMTNMMQVEHETLTAIIRNIKA